MKTVDIDREARLSQVTLTDGRVLRLNSEDQEVYERLSVDDAPARRPGRTPKGT